MRIKLFIKKFLNRLRSYIKNHSNRLWQKTCWDLRVKSGWARALPEFIIIGAQKAGTTSLFAYLEQHPQLVGSITKEIHYFDGGVDENVDNFALGEAWYQAHFPLKFTMDSDQKTFEASPEYIFNPLVSKRIHDLIPDVKIIVLLRNPTERAISHYFYEGIEDLPIHKALLAEEERLKNALETKNYKLYNFIHHSYISRGRYKEQIDRYLELFSRDQLLFASSEELFSQPDKTLKKIFEFVGVDTTFRIKDLKPRNVTKDKSKVNPDVYEYLDTYFQAYNQELYELIGEDYAW